MADSPEQHALEYARRNWSLVEGECNGLRADAIAVTAFAAGYRACAEDAEKAIVGHRVPETEAHLDIGHNLGIAYAVAAIRALAAPSAPAPGNAQDQPQHD